jgi:four helix bundle protein
MTAISSYRDLIVWQLGMELAERIYHLTATFPKHEQYGLASQTQRAAASIPANIAEGHAHDSTKEYLRHISIAVGSLAELETWLILARRLHYVEEQTLRDTIQFTEKLGRQLRNLQKALKAKLKRAQ